jgi:plasmid maintenance system antidote protein VapI
LLKPRPITNEGGFIMTRHDLPPVNSGEILLKDFVKPMEITRYRLAEAIGVPHRFIELHPNDAHSVGG